MRRERGGYLGRGSSKVDDDLPLEVEPGEVIVGHGRNAEAVADEYERGLERRSEVDPRTQHEMLADRERLYLPVPDERHATLGFHDLARTEFHRLVVAVRPSRLRAHELQLADDVLLGLSLTAAAGLATFKLVIGEHFHDFPPLGAVESCGALGADSAEKQNETD